MPCVCHSTTRARAATYKGLRPRVVLYIPYTLYGLLQQISMPVSIRRTSTGERSPLAAWSACTIQYDGLKASHLAQMIVFTHIGDHCTLEAVVINCDPITFLLITLLISNKPGAGRESIFYLLSSYCPLKAQVPISFGRI